MCQENTFKENAVLQFFLAYLIKATELTGV